MGGFCYREHGERSIEAKDLRKQRAYLEEAITVAEQEARSKLAKPVQRVRPNSSLRKSKNSGGKQPQNSAFDQT